MKPILSIFLLALLPLTHPCSAEQTVTFGEPNDSPTNWKALEQVHHPDGSITFSKTQDGITFKLNIRGEADVMVNPIHKGVQLYENGAGLGVIGNEMNTRISNGSYGTADNEYTVLTVSTSGATPSELSLKNINLRYTDPRQGTDFIHFVDHKRKSLKLPGAQDINYQQHPGLTPLRKHNLKVWSLSIGSVDRYDDAEATDGTFALGQISFSYTKAETMPQTIGLICE